MLDNPSKTPSLPRPASRQSADMDDILQKQNGVTSNSETQGSPMPSRELPKPPAKPQITSGIFPSAAVAPSRSNTLSWQQRPSSRGSTMGPVRSRPLSSLASENNASRSLRQGSLTASESDDSVSRSQITQSLEAKDPTFFKQTQDRGLGSAAYRKSQVEDLSDASSMGRNMRLPGTSRESTAETESRISSLPQTNHMDTSSREGSLCGSNGTSDMHQSSVSTSSKGGVRSPLPTSNNQHFERLPSDTTSSLGSGDASLIGRTVAMSPSQGRISPERTERPASPTKGLGGFVQSAMMKRSDSVNKRWSAQAGPGLSRGNSVTSNRSGLDGMRFSVGGVNPLADSRSTVSRETTPNTVSRPTSSHSNATMNQPSLEDQKSATGLSLRIKSSELSSSTSGSMPSPEKASTTPTQPLSPTKDEPMMEPPSSPSKRWSPTKSSWLENAISKPESPKLLSPSASQQPAWMADLNRNKQQRGSVDLGKGPAFKEVAVGGLVRSPPPGTGYKPPSIGGLPKGFSSGVAMKPRTSSSDDVRRSDSSEPMRQTGKLSGSSISPNLSGRVEKAPTSPPATLKPSQKDSSISSIRTKPETPPKKDFQTTLKPRQTAGESKGKDEPEFKNVFGKLKKTQTQNYVAPDELKDNIMRGKSGLAKTDGPQKSKIKDEFKESILKKKEGMIAPSASTRITSASSKNPQTSTPEAIAKRKGLGRSDSTISNNSVEERMPAPKPEALAKLQSMQEKPKVVALEKQNSAPATIPQTSGNSKPGFGSGFASSLAGMLQRGPSPIGGAANPPPKSQEDGALNISTIGKAEAAQEPQNGPELTHVTKGRARGPRRKPPSSIKQENSASHTAAPSEPLIKQSVAQRMPPTSSLTPKPEASPDRSGPRPLAIITNNNNSNRKTSQPNTPRKPSTSIGKPQSSNPSPVIAQGPVDEPPMKASIVTAKKPTQSPNISEVQNPVVSTSPRKIDLLRDPTSQTDAQQKTEDVPIAQGLGDRQTQQYVKSMAGIWSGSPEPTRSGQPRSPLKLPTRQDEETAMANADSRTKEVVGLGIENPGETAQVSRQEAASRSTKSPRSPPLLGRKPATIDVKSSATPLPSRAPTKRNASPSKEPSESGKLFTEIFDELPPSNTKINIDTQAVLDAPSSSNPEKIKTLRKQIFEIIDNGKSIPVISQQEHILFEDSLYVCTHVFGTPAGTRTTEVYLWCGDGVSSSAIEDAQLFAKKTAKDNGGRLIILQQGKETSNFFQALGGIVITRKGSSSRSDSAIYMLCGRQHLGQIAFDEVDFQPQSLCTGFPYIISARGGRLYLWKGSGAGANELGCARLIGMDLGLIGEIEEIDEGKEPLEFWSSFPRGTSKLTDVPFPAQHWRLKPSYERYATKFFAVDVEIPLPKSSSGFMSWGRRGSAPTNEASSAIEARIREISPFSQADLVDEGFFVLDTYFEIYVYVHLPISFLHDEVLNHSGSIHPLRTSLNPPPQHRSTKAASLRAALLFAQDYGILAASAEDRPFVPHGSVVIMAKHDGGPKGTGGGEVPESMRMCFRKWNSRGIGGGDAKVLSLTEALASAES